MKMSRLVVKTAVVGLAAYGARELWSRYQKPAADAIDEQIAPAVRDAARSVKASSSAAAQNLKESAKSAMTAVADADGETASPAPELVTPPGPGRTAEDHESASLESDAKRLQDSTLVKEG